MAMAAPVLSLAATGLSAMGSMDQAKGQAQADAFQAKQALEASEYGRIKAAQTGAIMTQNMQAMLGHIAAVRASGGVDPRSPTTAAILGRQESIAETARSQQIANIEAQVRSDKESSQMYTDMAGRAIAGGNMAAMGTVVGALGGAFKSLGSPGFGSSFSFFGNS